MGFLLFFETRFLCTSPSSPGTQFFCCLGDPPASASHTLELKVGSCHTQLGRNFLGGYHLGLEKGQEPHQGHCGLGLLSDSVRLFLAWRPFLLATVCHAPESRTPCVARMVSKSGQSSCLYFTRPGLRLCATIPGS